MPGGGQAGNEQTPFISKALSSAFEAVTDGKKHNLYIVSKPNDAAEPNEVAVQWIQFISLMKIGCLFWETADLLFVECLLLYCQYSFLLLIPPEAIRQWHLAEHFYHFHFFRW